MTANAFLRPQLEELARRGWDVHLTTSPVEGYSDLLSIEGITLHPLPMKRKPSPFSDLVSLRAWKVLIRTLKPDFVVASTPKAGLLGMISAKSLKTKVRIYHLRGLRAEGQKGLARKVGLFLEQVAITSATHVLSDSKSLITTAVNLGLNFDEKVKVLGAGSCCGVDTEHFRPPLEAEHKFARAEFGFTDPDVVIAFVGRLVRDKGLLDLVEVLQHLNKTHPSLKLLAVGPEDAELTIKDIQQKFDPDHKFLKLTGALDDPRAAYWASDFSVFPSYREGFPIAPLEAQSCGLPVVTTTATGCLDSVVPDSSGLLIKLGSFDELSQSITTLMHNAELREKLGTNARDWVVTEFNATDVTNRFCDYLESAVAVKGAHL